MLQAYLNSNDRKVHVPVQDPDSPHKTVDSIVALVNELGADSVFIVGSSRGGFYGLRVAQLTNVPSLLINPALNFSGTVYDYMLSEDGKDRTDTVYSEINEIRKQIISNPINQTQINLFISKNDELLDHSELMELINKPKSIELFEDTHKFTGFVATLPKIKSMIESL
jgi:predicted esterase YcpF (UPF0227 family)